MRGIFVTGTDTDVGKTRVCAALLAGAPADWRYWKPVQTGLADDPGDTAMVRQLANVSAVQAPDVGVRLDAAVSPHFAAQAAGQRIELATLRQQAAHMLGAGVFAVVEGAGGLLTPLNDRETMLDLARALALPVLIVVRVKLGAINHALLTERVLRDSGVPTVGFLLSGDADPSLVSALRVHARVPVVGRLPECQPDTPPVPHGERLRTALREILS